MLVWAHLAQGSCSQSTHPFILWPPIYVMGTGMWAALVHCDGRREGRAAMEPISLECTLSGLGHGSLLASEPCWRPSPTRLEGEC